jgi:hypothetical protein
MGEHNESKLVAEPLDEINRSGIMSNPLMAAESIQGAENSVPSSEGNSADMALERTEYLQRGEKIGALPAIINAHADCKMGLVSEQQLAVLLDKLGERLAFERQGTRFYEACVQKFESMPIPNLEIPTVEDLRHICFEERQHFELLQRAIVKLGGDATVQSPSADVAGVLSHGLLIVVSDPRTSVAQTLQAALIAELADNDGWEMLQQLAEQLGQVELARQCRLALDAETEHLESVRGWLSNIILREIDQSETDLKSAP